MSFAGFITGLIGLAGGVGGAVLLNVLTYREHMRRYGPAEYWGEFVCVPLGLLFGTTSALALRYWVRRSERPSRAAPADASPQPQWGRRLGAVVLWILIVCSLRLVVDSISLSSLASLSATFIAWLGSITLCIYLSRASR